MRATQAVIKESSLPGSRSLHAVVELILTGEAATMNRPVYSHDSRIMRVYIVRCSQITARVLRTHTTGGTQIVFISYSQEDLEAADKVVRFLESVNHRCWITPRDIPAGDDWAEAIISAIDNSEAVVLILSASSNSSPHVRREIEHAVSICRKIIPVVIENVKLSKWMKYCISVHQWHDACTGTLDLALPALEKALASCEADEIEEELRELSVNEAVYLEPSELRPVLVVSLLLPASKSIPARRTYPLMDRLSRKHSGMLLPGDDERRLRCFFGLSSSLEDLKQGALLFAEEAAGVLSKSVRKGTDALHDVPFGVGVSVGTCEISWLGRYPVIRGVAVGEADSISAQGRLVFSQSCMDLCCNEVLKEFRGMEKHLKAMPSMEPRIIPFTGRKKLLDSLAGLRKKQRISAEMNRRGGAVHITLGVQGEPGVGKTRLIREFLNSFPGGTGVIHFSPGSCSGMAELSEFLLHEFGISEGHWRTEHPGNAETTVSDKERIALYTAIRDSLAVKASEELVLVIDDAQKLSTSSRELLEFLVENTDSPRPILFIFLYRKTDNCGNRVRFSFSGSFTTTSEQNLLPLSEAETRMLSERTIESLSGKDAGVDDLLASLIFSKTAGNPFYVIEFIENCHKEGHMELRGDKWQIRANSDILSSSLSLSTSLNASIDSLPESWRRTLQICAAAGDPLPVQIANRLRISLPEDWFSLDALNYLTDRQYLIREQTAFSDAYRFRHDLLREAAFGGIAEANRMKIHLVAAEAYAAAFPDNDRYCTAIAHHYSRTDAADKTLEWSEKALSYCVRFFRYEEALLWIGVLKEANPPLVELGRLVLRESSILGFLGRNTERERLLLNHLESLKNNGGDYPAELLLHLGMLHHEQGNHETAEREMRRACCLTGDSENEALIAEINLAVASLLIDTNQRDEADSRLREAYSFFAKEENEHGMARVNRIDGERLYKAGELVASIEVFETALVHATECFDIRLQLSCLSAIGRSYYTLGQLDEAANYWKRDIEKARDLGFRYNECVVTRNLGAIHHTRCELQDALRYYRQSYDIARELDDSSNMGAALRNMTHIHTQLGDRRKSEELLNEAIALARESRNAHAESKSLLSLATLHNEFGNSMKAIDIYKECIHSCSVSGDRYTEAVAYASLACALQKTGEPEKALANCEKALSIFRVLNENSMVVSAQTNLGSIQITLGRLEEAYGNLMEALSLSESINDVFYREHLLSMIASYFVETGNLEKALLYSEESYETAKRNHSPAQTRANAGVILAYIKALLADDPADAVKLLDELQAFCEGKEDVAGEQASILFIHGLIENKKGRIGSATSFLERGIATMNSSDVPVYRVTGLEDLRTALGE
jgi:tetratricopeptide (TPR) repeat protein